MAGNQPELARQALERVVGLNPAFAGAWLDLALATYRSGDPTAAVEHLEYLRSQFSLPPALEAQVERWLSLWQNATQPVQAPLVPDWTGEIQLGAGFDGNANTGLDHQQITLSLPTGSAVFDIDSAYQPRADRFNLFALTLGGPARAWAGGRVTPVLLLRSKQFNQEHDFSTLDLQPGLLYQQAPGEAAGSWQAQLLAQHYSLGGQALFNGLRLAVQNSQPWRHCQASAGGEIEVRHHLRVPSLGGTLYSISATLGCRLSSDAQLGASLKTGMEQARLDRPGGNNRNAELTLRYEQALSSSQSLQMSWQLGHIADESGYSPLLENNAARSLQRQTLSLGLRQTLTPAWEARLNLDYFVQRANLPLFEQQGRLLMLALAYRFN